jgi:GTPase-activating protein SST2
MPSAARAGIPYKHSTTALPLRSTPRDATRSHAPDVTLHHGPDSDSTTAADIDPHQHPIATDTDTDTADKVDSPVRTAASKAKASAHSRLASLGRLRSRGSVPQQKQNPQRPQPVLLGETHPGPVSPSDAGSQHKPSDASTRSTSSSVTTLSDDAKSEKKSIEEQPSRPSFWLATGNVPGDSNKPENDHASAIEEQYRRLIQPKSRMMHQTSSKLLRMTDDERPFTRVRQHIHHMHSYAYLFCAGTVFLLIVAPCCSM